jgi:hypothetical protein
MLVIVVSQIISQRKWEWFGSIRRRRPLSDLQKFDSASRGIPGAVQLLPAVLWRDPITFTAAIIVCISFLVGPFVQQASRTSECTSVALGVKASLPFAHFVPRRNGYVSDVERDDLGVPAPDLITAILSVVTDPDGVQNRIRGSCATGQCTFPNGDPAYSDSGITDDKDSVTHSTVAMCSRCIDISSLVVRENATCGYPVLSLPNNLSLSRGCGDREVVRIQPSSDLSWMGSLLTSELRSFSRWAYVNASFMGLNSFANETVAAAMCSLYPCVKTYTTSITNNEVSETRVGSKVMQLDMLTKGGISEDGSHNALGNVYESYAAVQSPCRAQGKVYDLDRNKSVEVNGTDLVLHDFTDYGYQGASRSTSINITAPKECIYRQNPQFVVAVSRLLNNEIFNGSCSSIKTFNCRKPGRSDPDDKFIPGLGAETVLKTLYGESYKSPSNLTTGFSNVTEWFDLFAEAVTRKFRLEYGSAVEGNRNEDVLPLDEIQGLAWQQTTCVSMRGIWLVLPISLTVITAVLAVWTIATNWRDRHSRPVWKDNILPLMFYGRDIVDGALDKYNHASSEQTCQDQNADQSKDKNNPLETSNMNEIGHSTVVTIPWLYAINNSDEAPAFTTRTKWSWHPKKNYGAASDISLLDVPQRTELHPEAHEDQAVPADAGQREEIQTQEVAQSARDAQIPEVTETRGETRSREEAVLQHTSHIYPQAYTDEPIRASDDVDISSLGGSEQNMQIGEDSRESEHDNPRVNQ